MFEITDGPGGGADPIGDPPERAELRRAVRRLVAEVSPPERTRELDEAGAFDHELFAALAQMGVFAIDAGAAGAGDASGDVRDQLVVVEELAAGPTSMAAFAIAQYAAIRSLADFGSTDLQREVLRAAATGEAKVSFALSEPAGGTDVARVMRTSARPSASGFTISGQKMWTSGATLADWVLVMARTSPIERSAAEGVTMFLVERGAPGLTVQELDTFGIHGMSTCEVFLDEVAVGPDAVVGKVDAGMRQAFSSVNREGIQAAAATIGVGRGALELAVAYAREREVFGKPIGAFQVPQHWLVDGLVALEAARGLMVRAAEVEVAGGDSGALSSMAKLVASEAAVDISLRGMQLMGGMGYSREVAMQRYFRDGRLWSFSPLTNEMVRNRLGQSVLGLPRSF